MSLPVEALATAAAVVVGFLAVCTGVLVRAQHAADAAAESLRELATNVSALRDVLSDFRAEVRDLRDRVDDLETVLARMHDDHAPAQ